MVRETGHGSGESSGGGAPWAVVLEWVQVSVPCFVGLIQNTHKFDTYLLVFINCIKIMNSLNKVVSRNFYLKRNQCFQGHIIAVCSFRSSQILLESCTNAHLS